MNFNDDDKIRNRVVPGNPENSLELKKCGITSTCGDKAKKRPIEIFDMGRFFVRVAVPLHQNIEHGVRTLIKVMLLKE